MDSLKAYRDVKNSIDTALEKVSTATEASTGGNSANEGIRINY